MDKAVKSSIEQSVLCWLATANEHGEPNVSPKEIFAAYGEDEIIVANIASPGSVKNIKANPKVCLSFVNIFTQKGHKVKGEARVLLEGDEGHDERYAVLFRMVGDAFPIQSVIQLVISHVSPILAPSYHFHPEMTEQTRVKSAYRSYGVVAAKDRSL